MSFREELERRNVFRVGGAYLIAAWVVAQVVDVLGDPLKLPEWFDTAVVVLLAAGLPIALTLAWVFEVTPSGIRRTQKPETAAGQRISGQTLNYFVTALLAIAMIVMAVDVYVLGEARPERTATPLVAATTESIADVEGPTPAARHGSIAVLPFDDLSPSGGNAFVATGLYDEFRRTLAALQGFHVTGRESAAKHSDDTRAAPAIARDLGVAMIMVTSVSYADERIALAVRLRDGTTGETVWTKRYNRPFAEVFDIRSDVARNVASALGVQITPSEQTRLAKPLSQSPAAYALYLRALATFESGSDLEALEYLNRALAVDPNLAPAFARKAEFYAAQDRHAHPDAEQDEMPANALALQNAERALELDPESGRAWQVRGLVHERHWRWAEARDDFDRAFALGNIDLGAYARFLVHAGDAQRAVELAAENVALNPDDARAHAAQGYVLARSDRSEDALAAYEAAARLAPMQAELVLARAAILLELGDRVNAEQTLRAGGQLLSGKHRLRRLPWLAYMYSRLGRSEDSERLAHEYSAATQALLPEHGEGVWLHLALGETHEVFGWLSAALEQVEAQQRVDGTETLLALKDNVPHDPALENPELGEVRRRLQQMLER